MCSVPRRDIELKMCREMVWQEVWFGGIALSFGMINNGVVGERSK